jgi:hypothetical protein
LFLGVPAKELFRGFFGGFGALICYGQSASQKLLTTLSLLKRIYQGEPLDVLIIADIPRHQRHLMSKRGGGDNGIGQAHFPLSPKCDRSLNHSFIESAPGL